MNSSNCTTQGISRRKMIGRLLGTAGAGVALPGIAADHPVHRHLVSRVEAEEKSAPAGAAPAPGFLDDHQRATLAVLAERMVPGSERGQVSQFLDLALAADSAENQKRFIAALSVFDGEAIARFQAPFKDLTEAQQVELLTAASTAKPGAGGRPRRRRWVGPPPGDASRMTLRDHFDYLKGWIGGAYYNSEAGMKELGWTGETAFDRFPGCEHPGGHR